MQYSGHREHLVLSGYVREDTEDTAAGHYYVVVTFPDVTVRTAAALPIIGNLFDQAWSPDNRWMAITFSNTLYVIDILGTTPARQMTMDGLETDVMCIGWYPPEVYASGQAYLCNVYMGIG
ncbi:MAG: DPP IV N-terminal domain-containing protein [Anaerolineae bacterium]